MAETDLPALERAIQSALPHLPVLRHESLAASTTFRIGGPADLLVNVSGQDDAAQVAALARAAGVPIVPLGGGSNVLVADAGVRGVVLRFHGGEVVEDGNGLVRADAGVTINGLVRWLIARGLAGLEMWAGTPGTVGGAIYGNAHFQGRLISESVADVRLLRPDGTVVDVPAAAMAFGYDTSRLHTSEEIVVSARFVVVPGDPEQLRTTARASLAFRKRTQPLHLFSAGCVFQNPSSDDHMPPDIPRSAGALVDRAGLKGMTQDGVTVSPVHANFVTAERHATAGAVRRVIERCRVAVARQFGVHLRDEIVYLGDWTSNHQEEQP